MKKFSLLIVATLVLLGAIAAGAWWLKPSGLDSTRLALAEYDLEKLTCGSCVAKIETALDGLDGIGEVDVDVTRGRGQIRFDPAAASADAIAAIITEAGYPARLRTQLSPQQQAALSSEEARLSEQYVAKIGDRLIARDAFEQRIAQLAETKQIDDPARARMTAWSELLQEELLLGAAAAYGLVVQPGEVDARLAALRQRHPGFEERLISEYGSEQGVRAKLKNDMLIQRTIGQVVADVDGPAQQRAALQAWYGDLSRRAEVTIFDAQLKTITTAAGGGSGCACCG